MKKLTPEEKKKRDHEKMIRRKISSLATRVKNNCKKSGLRTIEIQQQWLKDNPTTELPVKELSFSETTEVWATGIERFKLDIEEEKQF